MPLDLTISGVEIYHKWRDGRILLVPFSAVYDTWAQRVYALAADVALWIPAAFLWRLSSPRPARKVVLYVVACAAVIEVVQIFVYSRVTSTTDLLTAGCGAAIGAMLAGGCGRPSAPAATADSSGSAGTRRFDLGVAIAGWMGVHHGRVLVSVRLQHRLGIRSRAAGDAAARAVRSLLFRHRVSCADRGVPQDWILLSAWRVAGRRSSRRSAGACPFPRSGCMRLAHCSLPVPPRESRLDSCCCRARMRTRRTGCWRRSADSPVT